MTAKEFLDRITDANRRLNAANRKVNLYASLAENVTASIGGEQVTHTRDVTANEKAILRLMEARDQADQIKRERQVIEDEIVDTLAKLKDVESEELLVYHYVKNFSLPAVSKKMHICRSVIYLRHEEALQKLDVLLKKNGRLRTQTDGYGRSRTQTDEKSVL